MSSSEEDDDFDIEAYQREGEIQAEEDPYNLNYIQDDKGQQEMKDIKEELKKQNDQKKSFKILEYLQYFCSFSSALYCHYNTGHIDQDICSRYNFYMFGSGLKL